MQILQIKRSQGLHNGKAGTLNHWLPCGGSTSVAKQKDPPLFKRFDAELSKL